MLKLFVVLYNLLINYLIEILIFKLGAFHIFCAHLPLHPLSLVVRITIPAFRNLMLTFIWFCFFHVISIIMQRVFGSICRRSLVLFYIKRVLRAVLSVAPKLASVSASLRQCTRNSVLFSYSRDVGAWVNSLTYFFGLASDRFIVQIRQPKGIYWNLGSLCVTRESAHSLHMFIVRVLLNVASYIGSIKWSLRTFASFQDNLGAIYRRGLPSYLQQIHLLLWYSQEKALLPTRINADFYRVGSLELSPVSRIIGWVTMCMSLSYLSIILSLLLKKYEGPFWWNSFHHWMLKIPPSPQGPRV